MKYQAFQSIILSSKCPIPLAVRSESFYQQNESIVPYIEPTFSKLDFPTEKPAILLVTAMGASGKTTTARSLSASTGLPILDLAKHKPVGDNTLTGILTSAYEIERIGEVLHGLRSGTHGVIIDGIDEARSKTTEKAFEAFLDDVIERSRGACSTTIVIFGRSQVLIDTWCYLSDKGSDVGVMQIDPFNLQQAKAYIDSLAAPSNSCSSNYEQARDNVLSKLGVAFSGSVSTPQDSFLAFLGYPPVLDAVATLLKKERNYYKIRQALDDVGRTEMEVHLLLWIAHYLLDRDHSDKAIPNFINPILSEMPTEKAQSLSEYLYDRDEQCARVLCFSLGLPFPRKVISDLALNDRYEQAVAVWCPDHPFLTDTSIRNPVFAAVAVTHCALSCYPEYRDLAQRYTAIHQPTSHLLHMMDSLGNGRRISVNCFNMLMQACAEYVAIDASILCEVSGQEWDDAEQALSTEAELSIDILFPTEENKHSVSFLGELDTDSVSFGPYLFNAQVTLPCSVTLTGSPTLTAIGDCSISAQAVRIESGDLIVRAAPTSKEHKPEKGALVIVAPKLEGHVDSVSLGSADLVLLCLQHSLDHPLTKYTQKGEISPPDPTLRLKYRRLRRILLEFRSHSRGGLAKFRQKIEHERVLQNDLGQSILTELVRREVLRRDARFYHIDAAVCDRVLGISWHQLRQYRSSPQLDRFLRDIPAQDA